MSKKNSQRECDQWNVTNPVGTAVWLERDGGAIEETTTRTQAYVCDAGYPVIFLEGIRGYYLLSRVTLRRSPDSPRVA